MAADTIAEDVHVVEIRGQPGGGKVTIVAGVSACNVRRVFSGCGETVVTTNTISGNAGMIENGRCPRRGIVAIVTLVP